jgi:hypothetical protein
MNRIEVIRKINLEFSEFDVKSLQSNLNKLLTASGDVIQSISEQKPRLRKGEVFIETLMIKMLFTSQSILNLSNGGFIRSKKYDTNIPFIDISAIYILVRSLLEIFLTLEYLFFNKLSVEEKEFRFELWRISGFKSRQFPIEQTGDQFRDKLVKEKKLIEEIMLKLKENPLYSTLGSNRSGRLDKYGLPRILSWTKLIELSKLNTRIFERAYTLYTNYSHSEYISMIQLNEGSQRIENVENIKNLATALNNVQLLNSSALFALKDYFECASVVYDSLPEKLKIRIEFLHDLATSD